MAMSAYFLLRAQANRTLSVAVKALDEFGNASEAKSQPVVGVWSASDPQGTSPPAFTPSSFNSMSFGMTRLDAQVNTSTNVLVGISDLRGDGRPDYHYEARVLYADSLSIATCKRGRRPRHSPGHRFLSRTHGRGGQSHGAAAYH